MVCLKVETIAAINNKICSVLNNTHGLTSLECVHIEAKPGVSWVSQPHFAVLGQAWIGSLITSYCSLSELHSAAPKLEGSVNGVLLFRGQVIFIKNFDPINIRKP